MTRYEIVDGHIKVAYGSDHITGYFLAVDDARLKWKGQAAQDVNKIVEKVSPTGDGNYFDLHTGPHGFGQKVSNEVMAEFLKRYGANPAHIENVRKGQHF